MPKGVGFKGTSGKSFSVGGTSGTSTNKKESSSKKKRKASELTHTEDTFERRRSKRVESNRLEAMKEYELATGPATSQYDRTPHFARKMKVGSDGRYYTASDVRSDLNHDIDASLQTFPSLNKAVTAGAWPSAALKLESEARKNGSVHIEGRSSATGFKQGHDSTLTYTRGTISNVRTPQDTPEPRSPRPFRADTRYERAHTAPFALTGAPGHTVWAPTQANQVVDTHHERHAGVSGGQLFRQDTYEASTLYSSRPVKDGVEVKQSHYRRRY